MISSIRNGSAPAHRNRILQGSFLSSVIWRGLQTAWAWCHMSKIGGELMAFNGHTIIDGDGHVIEDTKAIVEFMPESYREKYDTHPFFNPFPPLDHLHSSNLHDFPPGAFNKVDANGWVAFLEDVGIETAVLYTTLGLAFGKIVSRDWAIDVARAYNDWLYNTYMKRSPRFKGMALIPLQEPEAAVEELRRAVKE